MRTNGCDRGENGGVRIGPVLLVAIESSAQLLIGCRKGDVWHASQSENLQNLSAVADRLGDGGVLALVATVRCAKMSKHTSASVNCVDDLPSLMVDLSIE